VLVPKYQIDRRQASGTAGFTTLVETISHEQACLRILY
jgi:hypothetical protein